MADDPQVRQHWTLAQGELALQQVHDALDGFWRQLGDHATGVAVGTWRHEFDTALVEILSNVVRHARPHAPIRLELSLYPDRLEARLRDDGGPYVAPDRLGAPTLDELAFSLAEGGYGMRMAEAALDRLEYTRAPDGTNHWQLVKLLPDAPRAISRSS